MKYCHNCELSIGETATFCATCGALVPVEAATQGSAAPPAAPPAAPSAAPPATPSAAPPAAPPSDFRPALVANAAPLVSPAPAVTGPAACRLCGRTATAVEDGVCPACRDDLALFLAMGAEGSVGVSLAGCLPATGRERVTVSNVIYSALADDDTCPECRAMDGRETNDLAAAATWAPHRHCHSPQGCRCAVFYEHESLAADEELAFIEYAAARGLHVTAPAVSAFHDEARTAGGHLEDASRSLDEARTLEKHDPQQAVTRYRQAIESLMAYGESPLDERRVRRDLPVAFNRLTLVLKALGREDEALEEIDRAAGLGILERDDCGRKSDREALRHRSRRLRERRTVTVGV